jgi:hypothetical protein
MTDRLVGVLRVKNVITPAKRNRKLACQYQAQKIYHIIILLRCRYLHHQLHLRYEIRGSHGGENIFRAEDGGIVFLGNIGTPLTIPHGATIQKTTSSSSSLDVPHAVA